MSLGIRFHEDPFRIDGALGFFQRASQEQEQEEEQEEQESGM